MKILWLCNYPLPIIAADLGMEARVNEGWLQGLSETLLKTYNVQLVYVFPQNIEKKVLEGHLTQIDYYGFYQSNSNPSVKNQNLFKLFAEIVGKTSPDVIHMMGTEYAHSCSMIDVVEKKGISNQTIVSIQGMPSFYWKHYLTGIPYSVCKRKRIKDIIFRSDLLKQQKLMQQRGECEQYVLRKALNVFGRTDWDNACTSQINEKRKYFYGGEILRKCFYTGTWDINTIERHSIFISQATYPVKGFHFMIEAAGILIDKYPDMKIYVSGRNIYSGALWKKSSYEKYVRDLIKKNGLEDNIIFTGALQADEMKKRYLSCNVFVSASTIENSPNSVGEAMILGVPTISSDVGGVKDMLTHKKEGYIYPVDEAYMLAYYIDRIFAEDLLAQNMGNAARIHALKTHDQNMIGKEVFSVYENVSQKM